MTIETTPLADLGRQADELDGLTRIETHPRQTATPIILDMLRSVYPHDQIFGDFCPVQGYVNAPARELYEWLLSLIHI